MTSCRELFSTKGLEGKDLQQKVEEQFPNGACEAEAVSECSSGPVDNSETMARLIFSPIHLDERGDIVSSAFSDAWNSDLSVFREEKASREELDYAITKVKEIGLAKVPPRPRELVAVGMAKASVVRAIRTKSNSNAFRIYDTANANAPDHASVFVTKAGRSEMSEKQVRRRLFEVFVRSKKYRDIL
ncbi:hypothetical protein [Rhodomicrobium lacus]|uniref:hypothetical protein n=1 Tax=Rhodomicrobium lacus TaxID=2498452 RepID=UPI000F8E8D16|nr:hypothetical protein [Rhodomicrobium lacus]